MISRTFKLCLNAGNGSAPYINVNQYDEGETWLFELYSENGERYIPSSGAIVGVKSDGHGIVNTGTVDSEGRVVITETQQMTASAGRAIYELSIDDLTHGTANFIVAVERKPTDDAVMSDSDLSLIQEAIDSAEVIVEVIGDGDPSEVIGEHVDAWLDNHPEATTTVQDGAITAPKINNSLWDKLLVNEEASGAVASFEDGADDVPVSSLKVSLEPIQTGTGDPSPTNIRPISGHSSVTVQRTGKNLWSLANEFTSTASGQWVLTDTAMTLKAGTYTVSLDTSVTGNGSVLFNFKTPSSTNGVTVSTAGTATRVSATFTIDEDLTAVAICIYGTAKTIRNIQIELGSTATTYEPYTGNTYPYTLGQTVYGGTVDLATGVLTVTNGIVTDFSALASNGTSSTGAYRYKLAVAGVAGFTVGEAKCNMLKFKAGFNDDAGEFYNATDVFNIFLADSTVASAITTLTGCQIVYPLATPQTIQLTPQEVKTLLGYNNISSTGTVDVVYHADTKLYVDKMTNVDNNIIAPTEETFTATRNYTVNDLVIVADTLYKVTANIASGSAITPNSNVTQTTLGALIKALS